MLARGGRAGFSQHARRGQQVLSPGAGTHVLGGGPDGASTGGMITGVGSGAGAGIVPPLPSGTGAGDGAGAAGAAGTVAGGSAGATGWK